VTPEKTLDKTPDGTPLLPPAKYDEKPSITLDSKNLQVVLTNKGAGVEKLLLHYPKPGETVTVLRPMGIAAPHMALRNPDGPDAIETLPWEVVEQKPDRAEFRFRLRNGIEITKVFVLEPERHTLQMTVMLDNKNPAKEGEKPAEKDVKLELLAFNGMDPDSIYRYEQYLTGVYRYDKNLKMKSLQGDIVKGEGKLKDALKMAPGADQDKEVKTIEKDYFNVDGGLKEWFGIKNRFFATVVLPDSAALDVLDHYTFRDLPEAALKYEENRHNIVASAVLNNIHVGESRKVFQFTIYGGPLDPSVLREVAGAEDLGKYTGGCFLAPVVKPAAAIIMEVLHFVKNLLHNMGFAIIITTLLIRLCLFPLSLKSQKNAQQMQALSPKIQALKERYKDDQQKYGVEQMRLFKENGVNPVAGCLPLFIQMPIFIGMYSVFEMSLDLRNSPFLFWIKDLSQPDRLFGPWTPIVIPMIITDIRIDAFNLLPILMTITWFLQAYFTPRSPDPQMAQQQKMMMWMPIVFGMTCYGLASGLSLYFLSNSLLSMAEQKIIKKYILKIPPGGPGAGNPGASIPFMAR
jgi:YidC/Oxa1 family membrane protein insertase